MAVFWCCSLVHNCYKCLPQKRSIQVLSNLSTPWLRFEAKKAKQKHFGYVWDMVAVVEDTYGLFVGDSNMNSVRQWNFFQCHCIRERTLIINTQEDTRQWRNEGKSDVWRFSDFLCNRWKMQQDDSIILECLICKLFCSTPAFPKMTQLCSLFAVGRFCVGS